MIFSMKVLHIIPRHFIFFVAFMSGMCATYSSRLLMIGKKDVGTL